MTPDERLQSIQQSIEERILPDLQVLKDELFKPGGISLAGRVTILDKEVKDIRWLVYKLFGILTTLGTLGGALLGFLKK
ncbi:MAG: hypothetical protein ACW98X_20045 [Promethearchaeota archaeon]|jgi:hypothetical protein